MAHTNHLFEESRPFLTEYSRDDLAIRQQFSIIAARCKTKWEKRLDDLKINGVVTCRTKDPASLKKKLQGMADEHRNLSLAELFKHPDMGDLAGIRIGVYLPEDVIKVNKAIEKKCTVLHTFGSVMGGRETGTHGRTRNLDVVRHMLGPWLSQDQNGNEEHWHHSGYKSWQLVITWPDPGYAPEGSVPDEYASDWPQPNRIEIQVGTVVSQAWGQIQHSIIYKRPRHQMATPSMRRMIDAVNGLAITTDIILEELQRSLVDAANQYEEYRRQPFQNGREFINWFQEEFLDGLSREELKTWSEKQDHSIADRLISDGLWCMCGCTGPRGPMTVVPVRPSSRRDSSSSRRHSIRWYSYQPGSPQLDPVPKPSPNNLKPAIERRLWPNGFNEDHPVNLEEDIALNLIYESVRGQHGSRCPLAELLKGRQAAIRSHISWLSRTSSEPQRSRISTLAPAIMPGITIRPQSTPSLEPRRCEILGQGLPWMAYEQGELNWVRDVCHDCQVQGGNCTCRHSSFEPMAHECIMKRGLQPGLTTPSYACTCRRSFS